MNMDLTSRNLDAEVSAMVFRVYDEVLKELSRDEITCVRLNTKILRAAARRMMGAAHSGERNPDVLALIIKDSVKAHFARQVPLAYTPPLPSA